MWIHYWVACRWRVRIFSVNIPFFYVEKGASCNIRCFFFFLFFFSVLLGCHLNLFPSVFCLSGFQPYLLLLLHLVFCKIIRRKIWSVFPLFSTTYPYNSSQRALNLRRRYLLIRMNLKLRRGRFSSWNAKTVFFFSFSSENLFHKL